MAPPIPHSRRPVDRGTILGEIISSPADLWGTLASAPVMRFVYGLPARGGRTGSRAPSRTTLMVPWLRDHGMDMIPYLFGSWTTCVRGSIYGARPGKAEDDPVLRPGTRKGGILSRFLIARVRQETDGIASRPRNGTWHSAVPCHGILARRCPYLSAAQPRWTFGGRRRDEAAVSSQEFLGRIPFSIACDRPCSTGGSMPSPMPSSRRESYQDDGTFCLWTCGPRNSLKDEGVVVQPSMCVEPLPMMEAKQGRHPREPGSESSGLPPILISM